MALPTPLTRVAACVLALLAPLSWAADLAAPDPGGDRWRFNGYATLGVAHVDAHPDWGFVRDNSQPAQAGGLKTGVDSRLGLQFNWKASNEVELVGQAVLRRQDDAAPAQRALDWAFAAWQPAPGWTLRAGRTSPDVFLLAEYRNVGFAFPWVRPNIEFYGFVPFQSLDGLDLARRWQDGAANWKAKLSFGRSATTLASQGDMPDGRPKSAVEIVNRDMLTAALSREEAGLTLKATYAQTRAAVAPSVPLAALRGGLDQLGASGVPGVAQEAQALSDALDYRGVNSRYVALAAHYESGAWQVSAEASKIALGQRSSSGSRGYVSAAYRVGSFTPFVMSGRAKARYPAASVPGHWAPVLAPLLGADAAAAAVQLGAAGAAASNASRYDQRSVSAGMRWDFSEGAAFKWQVDRFHVKAGGSGLWSQADGFSAGRATVFSATIDFLF